MSEDTNKQVPWKEFLCKAIAEAKKIFYNEDYVENATDTETLGVMMSVYSEWAINPLIEIFTDALTDSNAHSLCFFIEEISKHALGDDPSFNLKLGNPELVEELIKWITNYPEKNPLKLIESRVAFREKMKEKQ